ncbi:hypothetical protein [Alysiella crassa]|uniref:Lipoprotein n=1 Tax=Alysiella crassa TaxID=153491 RepID=A0A376BU38_9NEIS|nr:hypothetical protein [Alysiella crassa]UOP05886.1 hypothetical protein LVJ80_08325 [Alysiella crassa]SSY80313.1 Uncharacterised protein [Alysiella crassa]
MKFLIILTSLLMLAACGEIEAESARLKEQKKVEMENQGRVKVTRIARFHDDLAYQNNRGIYLIKDNKTGKEFIGISGIGITEIGSHWVGKSPVSDER